MSENQIQLPYENQEEHQLNDHQGFEINSLNNNINTPINKRQIFRISTQQKKKFKSPRSKSQQIVTVYSNTANDTLTKEKAIVTEEDLSKYRIQLFQSPIDKDRTSHDINLQQDLMNNQRNRKKYQDRIERKHILKSKTQNILNDNNNDRIHKKPKEKSKEIDQFQAELMQEILEDQLLRQEQLQSVNNKLKNLYVQYFPNPEDVPVANHVNHSNTKHLEMITKEKSIGRKIKKFLLNLYHKRPYYLRLTRDDHLMIHDISSSEVHFIPKQKEKEKTKNIFLRLYLFIVNFLFVFFKELDKRVVLLQPESYYLKIWDGLHTLTIVIAIFYVPMQWIYQRRFINQYTWGFRYLVIITAITFTMNVVFLLNQGFYEKGQLVMNRSRIIQKFFRQYFFCEILSLLPVLDSLFFFTQKSTVLSLVVFFKLKSFNEIIIGYEEIFLNRRIPLITSIIKLNRLIMLLVFITHLIAILFLGMSRIDTGYQTQWIKQYSTATGFPLESQDWDIQYIFSFYWSATTMTTVGYGDITPSNTYEVILNIFILFLSVYIYSYSFSLINDVVKQINQGKNTEKNRIMHMVERYFFEKGISKPLRIHIRSEIDKLYSDNINLSSDQMDVIKELFQKFDMNTQNMLVKEESLIYLEKCPPVYFNFSDETLHRIAYELRSKNFKHRDIIFNEKDDNNDQNTNLYFIKDGHVQLFIRNDKDYVEGFRPVQILNQYDYFGQIGFFFCQPRICSARSKGHSEIFMISRAKFLQIIRQNPEDYEQFLMIKDSFLNQDMRLLNYKCYSCEREGHTIMNCPKIHFAPDRERIYLQQRFQFQRLRLSQTRTPLMKKNSFLYMEAHRNFTEDLKQQLGINIEELQLSEDILVANQLEIQKEQKQPQFQLDILEIQEQKLKKDISEQPDINDNGIVDKIAPTKSKFFEATNHLNSENSGLIRVQEGQEIKVSDRSDIQIQSSLFSEIKRRGSQNTISSILFNQKIDQKQNSVTNPILPLLSPQAEISKFNQTASLKFTINSQHEPYPVISPIGDNEDKPLLEDELSEESNIDISSIKEETGRKSLIRHIRDGQKAQLKDQIIKIKNIQTKHQQGVIEPLQLDRDMSPEIEINKFLKDDDQQIRGVNEYLHLTNEELLENFDYSQKFQVYMRKDNKKLGYYHFLNQQKKQNYAQRDPKYHLYKPQIIPSTDKQNFDLIS